jgi:hypothetical protein
MDQKMGGKPRLRVLVKGGADVVDAVLATDEGGGKLEQGLSARVHEAHGGAFEVGVRHEECGPAAELAAQLRGDGPATALLDWEPDVVVLGMSADAGTDPAAYRDQMAEVVASLKERVGAHVIVFNGSSIDPDDTASGYTRGLDTPVLRVHRLNRVLVELSMLEGVSLVDVDRLLAELGAAGHVTGLLDYDAEACGVLCDELMRVLADYGFFEERPLVAQLGSRGRKR